jgi:hypothetical protein
MKKLSIYCMALKNENLKTIKSLNYIPVGLKNNNFSNEWLRDNTKDNISQKNPYYGEYTFYYWYWKNLLQFKKSDEWVGFCSYREYWSSKIKKKTNNIQDLVLKEYQSEWSNYDAIIGEPISINSTKFMKVLKYGKLAMIRNPKAIFFKKGRTIRWQFDMFHGNGNLDKAIEMLPDIDRDDFKYFTRNETSFSRGNMFISNSKEIINDYFKNVFDWLNKLEKIFGFNLNGYGKVRMYTFLAERYLPFWFKKYTKFKEWPIVYHDINKND